MAEELADRLPVARVVGHKMTGAERKAIVEMAKEEEHADLRHRKLAHMLGRIKKPDSTRGYAAHARDAFDLHENVGVP